MVQNDSNTYPVGNPKDWCDQLQIPFELLPNKQLSSEELRVYLSLLWLCKGGPVCKENISVIAYWASLSYDRTQRYLVQLKELGLIGVRRCFREESVYTLRLHPMLRDHSLLSRDKSRKNKNKNLSGLIPNVGKVTIRNNQLSGKWGIPPDLNETGVEKLRRDIEARVTAAIRAAVLEHRRG